MYARTPTPDRGRWIATPDRGHQQPRRASRPLQRELEERKDVAALIDELADRLAHAVTSVGVDPDEDRRVACLRGLERRRELERVPRDDAVVVVAGRHERRGICDARPDVVERRVREQLRNSLGIVGRTVVARPAPADGEPVEPEHVHHPYLGDRPHRTVQGAG